MPTPPPLPAGRIAKRSPYLSTSFWRRRMRCRPRLMFSYTATRISLAHILYQSRMIIFATGCKQLQCLRAHRIQSNPRGFLDPLALKWRTSLPRFVPPKGLAPCLSPWCLGCRLFSAASESLVQLASRARRRRFLPIDGASHAKSSG
jgi:hypothetical protein